MDFGWLYDLAGRADGALSGGLPDAGPGLVVLLALALGLRHATDPDHLVAVGALMAASGADAGPRDAMRLGAWWGAGHAATLLVLGLPLVLMGAGMPGWLEAGAEPAIGAVIVVLAARALWRVARPDGTATPRSPAQAAGIGVLHGLGGTGAVVLLFAVSLHSAPEAALALAVFAPMSVASMALCTGAFGWALTRPAVTPVVDRVVVPVLALLAVAFGCWYAGLTV